MTARREKNDRQVTLCAQRRHDLPAVDAGQHDVEHDQFVRMRERLMQPVVAVANEIDLTARLGEPFFQVVAGLAVVFDNEDGHARGDEWRKDILASARRCPPKMTKKS